MGFISRILNCFRKKRVVYQLQKVFTPTTYAELSYKKRPELERRLKSAILQPGMQVILYGHSQSGKSTLLHNVLKENNLLSITSRCITNTTIDELILSAFDKLDVYYTDTTSDSYTYSLSSSLKSEYLAISSTINASVGENHNEMRKRILPPQLTVQRLADFIGEANCLWIIEDFHKVDHEEKVKLSQALKLFVDMANVYPNLKIIAVGAADTGHEVVAYDNELSNRVAEIEVPLLSSPEIMEILNTGTKLLNIEFDNELKKNIIKNSNSLATIVHQLAYNICNENDIYNTVKNCIYFEEEVLNKSIETYVANRKDTFKQLYKKITAQRSGRYRNVELILRAIVKLNSSEFIQHDILLKICEKEPDYNPGNLSFYLKKLCSSECEEVLRQNMGRYSFSDPFFEAYIRMINRISEHEESNVETDVNTSDIITALNAFHFFSV